MITPIPRAAPTAADSTSSYSKSSSASTLTTSYMRNELSSTEVPLITKAASDDSDNSDLWVGLGVIGGTIICFVFTIYWCCGRRKSCLRRRLRERKYKKLAEGGNEQASGANLHRLSVPNKDENPRPSFDAESMRPTCETGMLTYRVEHIPRNMNAEGVRTLFSSSVTVRSLAPTVWMNDARTNEETFQVATVEYKESILGLKSNGPSLSHEGKMYGIQVDSRFNGFTPLNDAVYPIKADLVAVTGLAGHAFGSWAHDKEHSWLREYLPKDIHNLRVMTYGYDSQLAEGQQSRQDVEMHAQDFATRLEQLWESTNYKRPTILVGHSLGCLLIVSALNRAKNFRHSPRNLEEIVPRVIFFGAPFGGLETVALEMLVKGTPSQILVEDLKPGSIVLKQLTNNFKKISRNMSIMSIYERKPTPTAIRTGTGEWKREGPMMMMVDQERACLYFDNEDTVSSQTDHKGIAKLTNSENTPYGAVCRFIIAAMEAPLDRQRSVFQRR